MLAEQTEPATRLAASAPESVPTPASSLTPALAFPPPEMTRASPRKAAVAAPRPRLPAIDLSGARAARVLVPRPERGGKVVILQVGCGGTGSWLAPSIGRLARTLLARQQPVEYVIIDPDVVEAKNVYRQNFCDAEIGRNKAVTMAVRLSQAWGIAIGGCAEPYTSCFTGIRPEPRYSDVVVLVGCVDNAAARRELAATFTREPWASLQAREPWRGSARAPARIPAPKLWWLDCGNHRDSGQVLIGNTVALVGLAGAFPLPRRCARLPAPSLLHPSLLDDRVGGAGPAPAMDGHDGDGARSMSCEDMAGAHDQSLAVNQMVAAIASDYLVRLLSAGDLRRFATYFDLASMTVQSKPVTQEVVAAAVRADVSIFEEADRDKRAHGGRSEEKDRSVKGD